MCAGLWTCAWRNASTPTLAGPSRRPESWSNVRLEADDDATPRRLPAEAPVCTLGQGIEGRPPGGTIPAARRTSHAFKRVSTMSAFVWAGGSKADGGATVSVAEAPVPSDGMFIPGARRGPPEPPPREPGGDAAAVRSRFAILLEAWRFQQAPSRRTTPCAQPRARGR